MDAVRAYKIETERLIIRCYQPSDANMFKKSVDESIEHLKPWMPWAENEPECIEQKIIRLRRYRADFDMDRDYTFGIFDKEETKLIGSTGLHTRVGHKAREIGYWINVNYIQKGYATEATNALTKVGFEIENLDRIEIRCNVENVFSRKIPENLGYTLEAILKNRLTEGGAKRDVMIWTIFKEDYAKMSLKDLNLKAYDCLGHEIYPH